MIFELSSEHEAIRDLAREFGEGEIRPNVRKWGAEKRFPREVVRKMGELGFFGCCFPERYGGTETGFLAVALIAEEIGRASPGLGVTFNAQAMTCPFTILNWGTEAQIEQYVPKLIRGEWLGFFGLTEPGGGSDVAGAMKTRAIRSNGEWVINGSKMFATLTNLADCGVLFAKTDPDQGHRGISAFIAETGRPGFEARPIAMTAIGELLPSCELGLVDYRLPVQNLLHKEGVGFTIAMNALDYGRLTVAARAVGLARALYDEAVRYCNLREAFGQKIGSFQMIKKLIADMAVEIEAARLLVYKSAYLKDRGQAATRESAYAKYFAAEVAGRAALATAEIFGGYAHTDEYPISQWVNTALLIRTGEGSANIQRVLIADDALGWRPADRHQIKRRFPLRSDIPDTH